MYVSTCVCASQRESPQVISVCICFHGGALPHAVRRESFETGLLLLYSTGRVETSQGVCTAVINCHISQHLDKFLGKKCFINICSVYTACITQLSFCVSYT